MTHLPAATDDFRIINNSFKTLGINQLCFTNDVQLIFAKSCCFYTITSASKQYLNEKETENVVKRDTLNCNRIFWRLGRLEWNIKI